MGEANKSLFSHAPYLLEEGKGYFSVGFEGVSRVLVLVINENPGVGFSYIFSNINWVDYCNSILEGQDRRIQTAGAGETGRQAILKWRKPLLICRMESHLRLTSGLYRSICESGVGITVSGSCRWGETVNHYEG